MRGRRTSVNASSSVAIMALFSTSGLDLVQYQMPASHTQVLAIISKSTGRSQNPQNDCDYSQGSRHMELEQPVRSRALLSNHLITEISCIKDKKNHTC